MNYYKLLVVDVDGTIVDKNGVISVEDKKALAWVMASGITLSLSTGRIIKACRKILDSLSLDGFHIFFDGALVSNPLSNNEIYCQPINCELVEQAVKFARVNNIYLELYTKEQFFAEKKNWSDDVHYEFFGVAPTITSFDDIWLREQILKAEMVIRDQQERIKADLFKNAFNGLLRFSTAHSPAFPEIDFINVINSNVSKGEALKSLISFLGISTEETVAIGDGLNDISLLKTAGYSVAMGNAYSELKRVANCVTLDVENSGVAAVVKKLFYECN